MNQKRVLVPGVDYSLWPHLKWTRAQQLMSELYGKIQLWSASTPGGLSASISDDQKSVTFRARMPNQPPVYEWSLILGDALHNYRSALDAFAWDLAHLDGQKPRPQDEKRIYFPICLTHSAWLTQARGPLSSVPAEILARLNSVQPYAVPPVEEGVFVHLHELDIADKHRGLIRAAVIPRDKHHVRYGITLDGNVPLEEHIVGDPWEWMAGEGAIADGDAVFRIRTDTSIVSAESDLNLPVAIVVENRGSLHDVLGLANMIDEQMSLTFEIIETGAWKRYPEAHPVPAEHPYGGS